MDCIKVLWIEDQVDDFVDLIPVFKEISLNVDWVSDPDEISGKLSDKKYDAIMIDIKGERFNGIRVYKKFKKDFESIPVAFLSAYLDDPDVRSELKKLDKPVPVLDKNFPSYSVEVLRDTFRLKLDQLISGESTLENSVSYYDDPSQALGNHSRVDYSTYLSLSPLKQEHLQSIALEKAKPAIEELQQEGCVWFLIEAPSGEVVDFGDAPPERFGSRKLAVKSHDRNAPCFIFETVSPIEELTDFSCGKLYQYYFSMDIKLGDSKNIDRIHFDSGSAKSWFSDKFLSDRGIGFGLKPDHYFATGPEPLKINGEFVTFFRDEIDVQVYCQENDEDSIPTILEVNGLSRWRDLNFGGKAHENQLCEKCKPEGHCKNRVGLLGQNVLEEPGAFKLTLCGKSKKSTPKRDGQI